MSLEYSEQLSRHRSKELVCLASFLTYFTVGAVMSCSCNASDPLEESVAKADFDDTLSRVCVCLSLCVCIGPEGFSNWSFKVFSLCDSQSVFRSHSSNTRSELSQN